MLNVKTTTKFLSFLIKNIKYFNPKKKFKVKLDLKQKIKIIIINSDFHMKILKY